MLSAGLTITGASPTHAIHSVSSTRCGFSFAPHPWQVAPRRDPTVLIRAYTQINRCERTPIPGRSKPRSYNHLTIYTITEHWHQITASSDAEYPRPTRLRRFASSSYLRHDDDVHPSLIRSPLSPLTSPLCTIFVVFDILFGKLFVFLWKLSFLKEKTTNKSINGKSFNHRSGRSRHCCSP